ncbi:Protein of unknown function [Catalinimonas alkaloidigena]|uniref:DUF2452 domain-containing protein n=1 Tax=Catalinimonas alkaloidigena TaxID=1075417 RepID=A0A1G9QEC3_9BACT|nr:DUF2452 domain-containing protein [Catalinimonas alkaloidigena]SDM08675.1 Protein of unknown function [Catalinimonas alkaloidigena]
MHADDEPEFFEIDPDKMAENPGLLPYAHTVGSAVIRPEDKGKLKGRAVAAMHQQTDRQLRQLYEQMQTLALQAKALKQRVEVSERIYVSDMSFEPVIGNTYYFYERKNGTDVLSMVAPHEWGRSFPFRRFVAEATLLADHTWEVRFEEESPDA